MNHRPCPKVHSSPVHDFMMHSFIVRKASPEGYPLSSIRCIKRVARKSQLEVCERRGKSFIRYFKGPIIKVLRRNTPYGNIIYMLRLLENDGKTSFLSDLFSRSRYMKRVQLFNGRYTKGVSFVKNSIFKGKALDLGAKPLRAKLF